MLVPPSSGWTVTWHDMWDAVQLLNALAISWPDEALLALHAFAAVCNAEKRKVKVIAQQSEVSEEVAAGLGSEWVTIVRQ